MGNIIRFPSTSREGSATTQLLTDPPRFTHAVQFYEEPESLYDAVVTFLGAGIDAGDRLLVIATPQHREAFLQGIDRAAAARALASGQITLLDAHETLAKFMVGDEVDPDLFREMLDRAIAKLRADAPDVRIRAFGEMVDVLWRDGKASAALRLEELWDKACRKHSLSLLCAYVMGNFYRETDAQGFASVCEGHTHVIPTEACGRLDEPYARLREISLLQQRTRSLEAELHHRKGLETALREALRDRSRVEAELRESVRREREARARAEENDAFKEEFLNVLGHDLRNPLNTILTTARLMVMRGELAPESHKRLDRMVAAGVRMQRMIEQILDATRDRLSEGIPIECDEPRDLVPLVSQVVADARTSRPGRTILLAADGDCRASVDGERIEQVFRNLVSNAVAHGDPERPVRVTVEAGASVVRVEVHNDGPPIAPDVRALLFDPLERRRKTVGRSDGLGLGLYISKRIVRAHGGEIEVDSTEEAGTTFRVTLPRDP